MKSTDAQIIVEVAATEKAPIVLVEQFLDGLTLRWALSRSNVTFPQGGSTVYYARTFSVSDFKSQADGQIDSISVEFDNIDGTFDTYLEYYEFEGRMMHIKRIYRSGESLEIPSDKTMYNEVFYGEMETPQISGPDTVVFNANSGYNIDPPVLNKYYGSYCQHRFGDDECGVNLLDQSHHYRMSGTAANGTTSILKSTGFTQPSEHWKHGTVVVECSGIEYSRRVKSYSKGTASGEAHLDISLPVTIAAGDTFEITKGCDFTWETCGANNAWGPSGENTNNFLGFVHIGINRED